MEYNEIENLVKMLIDSESKELSIETEFQKIKIVRSYDEKIPKKTITSKVKIEEEEKLKAPKVSTIEIKSTLVGKFHFYKKFNVGDKIIVGEKIGYVESLKTQTDVVSAFSGNIIEIPTGDGDIVEFGQVIIVIE